MSRYDDVISNCSFGGGLFFISKDLLFDRYASILGYMRTFIVYKTESDHARDVTTFLEDFRRQTRKDLEVVDPETPQGAETCRVYDIVEYPTIVAVDDNGLLQNMWKGRPLPTISEISYYLG